MGQGEYDARLVGLHEGTEHIGLLGRGTNEETGVVVLVVLNAVLKHLQTVETRRLSMADGSPPMVLAFGNHLRRTGGIVTLDNTQLRMALQVVARLHEGHGVGMDLGKRLP